MEGMLEQDSFLYDPVVLFLSLLDRKLPASKRTLRERVDEQVVSDAEKWAADFLPLGLKAKRANDTLRETERLEAIVEETRIRASEMCNYLLVVVARHPDLKEKLKPRKGVDAKEALENMQDMRNRCDDHAKELKELGIVVKFDPIHSTAAVRQQAADHVAAQTELDLLHKRTDVTQESLVNQRAEGKRLRARVNEQVAAAIPGNRPMQVMWGFSEREAPRATTKKPSEEVTKPADTTNAKPTDGAPSEPAKPASDEKPQE